MEHNHWKMVSCSAINVRVQVSNAEAIKKRNMTLEAGTL